MPWDVDRVQTGGMTESQKRRATLAIVGLAAVILAAAAWAYLVWGDELRQLADESRALAVRFLERIHPLPYFLAFALTPALGVPVSLFYLTCGTVLAGSNAGIVGAIALAWLAIAINLGFGYWLASSLMNPPIAKLLRARGYEIPVAAPENEGTVILICRLSPLPFALQNWVLGVARFRFGRYLVYSWPLQAGIGSGMILVGDSLLRGGTGAAITGAFVVCVFILLARIVRKRFDVPAKRQDF